MTRAPVASRTAGQEVATAGQRRVEQHDVGLEERRVLPCVTDGFGACDRLDVVEKVQTRHQPPPVDRMGVEDEEFHPCGWLPSVKSLAILRPVPQYGQTGDCRDA